MHKDHRIRRLGITMMLSSLVLAATAMLGGPAIAEEPERKPVEITKEGSWYAPKGEVLPNTLVSEFPPGVVCIVQPDLCKDDYEVVYQPVEDAVTGAVAAEEEQQQTQPGNGASNPEALTVSSTGGKPDYRHAFAFALPTIPEGKQVDRFELQMTVGNPTYTQGSPAFRQAVLAAFTCVRGCQQDQFEKIPETDAREADLLGLEICPIAPDAEWVGERGQPEADLPELRCIVGQNGVYADGNAAVTFDLTLFLQDLEDSGATFNGFMLRPAGMPNLAYGDADPTFNKMVSVEKSGITYALATSDAPEDIDFDFGSGGDGLDSGSGGGFTTTDSGSSGGFSAPSSSGGGSSDIFSSPSTTDPEPAPAPEVAEAAPTGGEQQPLVADPVASEPLDEPNGAWYVWLLVPVFGAGMYLTAQSLTAAPIVAEAAGRSGAMTRLLEKKAASDVAAPELVSF